MLSPEDRRHAPEGITRDGVEQHAGQAFNPSRLKSSLLLRSGRPQAGGGGGGRVLAIPHPTQLFLERVREVLKRHSVEIPVPLRRRRKQFQHSSRGLRTGTASADRLQGVDRQAAVHGFFRHSPRQIVLPRWRPLRSKLVW